SPQLKILERIAAEGPQAFYRGEAAEAIGAECRRRGGLLTLDDLAGVQPAVRKPLRGTNGGLQLVTMPPPSSGGVALLQTLNTLREWEAMQPKDSAAPLTWNSPRYLHVLTEAMKHAFA